ncbi:MAG: ABC transporter permease [Clostridiales bacterium]|nr:ABC transporter permease [Clostridiales bacterium]
MVKRCLMKLSLSWILRHKERYVLSWISFAIISLFLIFVYSLAGGITSQVQDYVKNDHTSNQINIRNIRITEEGLDNDLTTDRVISLAKELGVKGVRALKNEEARISSVDGKSGEYQKVPVVKYYSPWGLMLANDYTDVTSSSGTIAGLNEGQAIVSEVFLQQTGTTEKDILGKTIRMTDGNEYTVSGLVKDLPQGSFLNTYAVFLADEKMTDNVDYVTFDFSDETDIRSRIKVIEDYGYSYSTNSISADRMNEIASQYSLAGTVIAIVFIIVCMVSLINSLLVTIGENAAFMELFRLLGLTGKDYMFMTCITAGIQGLIGGILGVILAYVTTGSLYKIVRNLNLKGMDILKDLQVTPKSCVMTLLICVVVSVLTGLAAFKLSSKVTADTIADSELI